MPPNPFKPTSSLLKPLTMHTTHFSFSLLSLHPFPSFPPPPRQPSRTPSWATYEKSLPAATSTVNAATGALTVGANRYTPKAFLPELNAIAASLTDVS